MSLHRVIIGFMPLLDAACIVAAVERGFAAHEGLDLALVRETSWANIRDRTIIGHFDAAHMLGPMTIASTLGIGHVRVPLIAPCALGLGGNAITVSLALWEQMQGAGARVGAGAPALGAALRAVVAARERAGGDPLTFAMVYPFSCHNYELRYWLAASKLHPDRDVRLVVMPPPFLADALRAGQIDGFCVGEPWSSVAVEAGAGVIATSTSAIWPRSPEKVLGCRSAWAQSHPQTLASLIRALHGASLWCEAAENHLELARLLSQPQYVGAPLELLKRALGNRLVLMRGGEPCPIEDFYVPARYAATFPWKSHASWIYSQMVRWRQTELTDEAAAAASSTYRPDLYRAALEPLAVALPSEDTKVERFFDGGAFDPADLRAYLATRTG